MREEGEQERQDKGEDAGGVEGEEEEDVGGGWEEKQDGKIEIGIECRIDIK